jgi:drug/metabolite transporter (DMT)-like permease
MTSLTSHPHPEPNTTAFISTIYLLATGSLLGLGTFLASAGIHAGWLPLALLFWSTFAAALILLIAAFAQGELPLISRHYLRYALLAGLLSFALPNMMSFAAISHVGSGFVALCLAFPPLITYAMALLLRLENPCIKGGIGMLLGLVGALLLSRSQFMSSDANLWAAITLSAPIIIAAGNIYRSVDWPKGASPQALAPLMLIGATLIIGVSAWIQNISLIPSLNTSMIAPVIALATCLAATYACYFILQKRTGPVGLSQIGWVGASVGKGLAIVFLGETMSPILLPAIAGILSGILFVSHRKR